MRAVETGLYDLALCAAKLPDGEAVEAVQYVLRHQCELPVVMIGEGHESAEMMRGVEAGATDFAVLEELHRQQVGRLIEKWILLQRLRCDEDCALRITQRKLTAEASRNRRLRGLVQRLDRKSRTDGLTGLYNRRWLDLAVQGMWTESVRHARPLAFMMADLDGFKAFNDLHVVTRRAMSCCDSPARRFG